MSQNFGQQVLESLFEPDTWAGMADDVLDAYSESIGSSSKRLVQGARRQVRIRLKNARRPA